MTHRFLALFVGQILIVLAVAVVARRAGGPDWIYYVTGVALLVPLVLIARRL